MFPRTARDVIAVKAKEGFLFSQRSRSERWFMRHRARLPPRASLHFFPSSVSRPLASCSLSAQQIQFLPCRIARTYFQSTPRLPMSDSICISILRDVHATLLKSIRSPAFNITRSRAVFVPCQIHTYTYVRTCHPNREWRSIAVSISSDWPYVLWLELLRITGDARRDLNLMAIYWEKTAVNATKCA